MTILPAPSGTRPASRRRRRKPVPAAYVSLFVPAARRRLWWYWYRCPICDTYQLGRARQLADVTGVRRGGCGHKITIVIARAYGDQAKTGVAS